MDSDPDNPTYSFPNPVVYQDNYDYSYQEYDTYVEIYNVYEDLETYYFEDNWYDYNYVYNYSNNLTQLYDYLTYVDCRYQYNTAVWWQWYDFYASFYYYRYAELEPTAWEMSIEDFLSYKRSMIREVLPQMPGLPILDSIWVDTTFGPVFGGYSYYQAVIEFDPDHVYTQLDWALGQDLRGNVREDILALHWLYHSYGSSDFVNLLHWKVGKDLDSAITAPTARIGEDYLYNAYYLATAVLLMEPQRSDFAELLGRVVMAFRWYGIRLDDGSRRQQF